MYNVEAIRVLRLDWNITKNIVKCIKIIKVSRVVKVRAIMIVETTSIRTADSIQSWQFTLA